MTFPPPLPKKKKKKKKEFIKAQLRMKLAEQLRLLEDSRC